jgi:hypothetical protein
MGSFVSSDLSPSLPLLCFILFTLFAF